MCGRYVSSLPAEAIARLFGTTNPLPNLRPTWNMAPSMDAPVIRLSLATGTRHLDALRWGLVPSFTNDLKSARKLINARSETVLSSGMFKAAFARRRCIVPADAFYKWQVTPSEKRPFAIARVDGAALAFAGLWEGWRDPDDNVLLTFAILTTTASDMMTELHQRIPVIVEQADRTTWRSADADADADAAAPMVRPAPGKAVRFWPAGREMGNVRNDGPHLVLPCKAPDQADSAEPHGPDTA